MPASAPPTRWWLRSAAVALGLVLAGLVLECALRIADAVHVGRGPLWAVADAELGYRNNPAWPGVNAEGLRQGPLAPPRPGEQRVLVLGDSVAYYGDGPDDTFPAHLEASLRERRVPVQVLNAGVRGWTHYQQLRYLEERGLALEPDVVCVAFVLNDCHRFLHRFRIEDGRIVGHRYEFTEEAVGRVGNPAYRLLRQSRALVWLRRRLDSVIDAPAVLAGGQAYSWELRPDFRTAWLESPWLQVAAQLERMRDLGREQGFELCVTVFPFADQYRPDYLARDRDYVLSPQARMRAIAERLELPYLDLYPELLPERHLLPDGIHLSAAGRVAVGRRLAAFLQATGLVASAE